MAENVFAVTQTRLGQASAIIDVDAEALAQGYVRNAQPGARTQSLLSCGTLIDGVDIRICDAAGSDSQDGEVGEVYVAGKSLFSGYYGQPTLTARRLRSGWFATGDMAFVRDQQLYVTGRVDDMIIVNGRNYYAHEIEILVNAVPGIVPGRSVSIGITDEESDTTGVIVLAEFDETSADATQVVRAVRVEVFERLGLSLRSIVPLRKGSLVKTTSGKISRVKNKEMYLHGLFQDVSVGKR
jgi:acyl-CoA synthetase (AMP-forming)/AMP-acid ligase II